MERINSWQAIIGNWEKGVLTQDGSTPTARLNQALTEVEELSTAHLTHERNPKDAAMEAADIVIALTGYIHSLGYDLENLLEEKVDIMYRKYPAHENKQLRDSGLTWKEAMRVQKTVYNNGHG